MCKIKVISILGTRPEIIKMQPILKDLSERENVDSYFVHTGQHYDWNMSASLMEQLALPKPDWFLNVGSGSHSRQTALIISRVERILKKCKPDVVLVQGDTNSALAGALAAAKLGLKIGHVEAGCRSFDKTMPEEINRVVISDLATYNFASTLTCYNNLLREGINQRNVFFSGHPIVDLIDEMRSRIADTSLLSKFGVDSKEYYLVTVHRDKNVDNLIHLNEIVKALSAVSKLHRVVFPVHPRTMKRLKKFRLLKLLDSVLLIEPVDYVSSLMLIANARAVLTDSGGIQQETFLLRTPCLTLRQNTEWVETVIAGVNFLVGHRCDRIVHGLQELENNYTSFHNIFLKAKDLYGGLGASRRIVDFLLDNTAI